MQPSSQDFGTEIQSPYQIHSRREIVALLRAIGEQKELIRMIVNDGSDVLLSAILDVDVEGDVVILDCPLDQELRGRILGADRLTLETSLDNIRILFSVEKIESCLYTERPALRIAIPSTLIRLQRREFYRMNTPLTNPICCTISPPEAPDLSNLIFALADISCGGIAIMDDKKLLGNDPGHVYENCRIDLPGIGILVTPLQIRNSQDLTLLNGKTNRRLGCQYIGLSQTMLASVQRYIMKLERERNAKAVGLR
ncbi:MAG: flagellar brake protein [Pseudomonadota bacterium]